ncbi:MAG: AAA family ATPase [Nanoarchaeota archaeon]
MSSREKVDKNMFSYSSLTDIGTHEEENRILRDTISQLRNEVDRYRAPALMVVDVCELIGEQAIIKVPNGNRFLVNISSSANGIKVGDTVLVEQKNLTIVDRIKSHRKFNVEHFIILEKPNVTWKDIGGLETQKNEIIEVIELPLKQPELFIDIGITPPKGILLHGPPGTGKTLLAKAVAQSTDSCFIQLVGSELVQKFIGEGAKLVKEIFMLAKQNAPAIIFIDEIDSLAAKRIELGTSGEREVQRTFMQLLSEIDGFKNLGDVKIIGCTNRIDILDPAILRPGRLDRLIEVPIPDKEGIKQIFSIHTAKMRLEYVNADKIIHLMKEFSGAEIKSVCTEAGYFAIRAGRRVVTEKDFESAVQKIRKADDTSCMAIYS